jgi:hypothetical protein
MAEWWRVIAASVKGSSHQEKMLPCQDVYAFRVLPGGELLAAVSDGAGSAGRSQDGAHRSVEAALAGLEALCQGVLPGDEAGWQAAIRSLFDEIQQELIALADAAGAPLNDFSATLTCALVTAEWLVVGQIGDGIAVAESATSANGMEYPLFLIARPQRGEYANETFFLTQPDAARSVIVYATRRPVRTLALATDGLLRLAIRLPGYEPHSGFFKPLFAFAREATNETLAQAELAAFLASERVCMRTDDDKTLLLAVYNDQYGKQPARRRGGRRKDVRV